MKRLSLYLFLIFFTLQTPSQADDIRDFQIEGMSIGDSLLDYFSEEEIKQNVSKNYYKDNKYTSIGLYKDKRFKTYESIEFNYLTKDNNYIIESISGAIFCSKNVSKCNNLQKQIESDISETFKNLEKKVQKQSHGADKSGKSKVSQILFYFKNGDFIAINVTDWSKELTQKNGWTDNFGLSLRTTDLNWWLVNKAYK